MLSPLRHLFSAGQPWACFLWAAVFAILSLLRVVPPTDGVLVPLSGVLLLLVLMMGLAPRQPWNSPSNRLGWVGLVLGALTSAGVYTVTRLGDAAWLAFSVTGMVWSFASGGWLLLRQPKTRAS